MMRFLRSQSQTVLILILAMLGLSFLFYGNVGSLLTNGSVAHGASDYGRIDGQDVSLAQLGNAIHETRDARILVALFTGRRPDLTGPNVRDEIAHEAWERLLLQHEADLLHIDVTDDQVISFIQSLPAMQTNGVYSPDLYQSILSRLDNEYKITPDRFVGFIHDHLRDEALNNALFNPVRPPVSNVNAQYQKSYGPVQASVLTFDPKVYAAKEQVGADEIQAEYQAHPDNPAYRTAEKRKVDYVLFPLTPDQEKLADKDKGAAMEALGQKALDFALSFQPEPTDGKSAPAAAPDFIAEAKKRGLAPATTDFFAADTPPAGLPPSPAFNNAAFALTKDDPVSSVVALSDGVAVLHLVDIQPSELRPLPEVQAAIAASLQKQKGTATAQAQASEAAKALQAGVDLAAEAAKLGVTVQQVGGLVPAKAPQGDERQQAIAYTAANLTPGQVSDPVPLPSDETVLVIKLDARAPADPADLPDFEKNFRSEMENQTRRLVEQDWADWLEHRPNTHRPPNLESYGSAD
jgi:peptidyl-prolyl cis-trans isomerase D